MSDYPQYPQQPQPPSEPPARNRNTQVQAGAATFVDIFLGLYKGMFELMSNLFKKMDDMEHESNVRAQELEERKATFEREMAAEPQTTALLQKMSETQAAMAERLDLSNETIAQLRQEIADLKKKQGD